MANYINPKLVEAAMKALQDYKQENPQSLLPLFSLCKSTDVRTREIFVRAAQRLKWNVVRSRGHVYENGQFIW